MAPFGYFISNCIIDGNLETALSRLSFCLRVKSICACVWWLTRCLVSDSVGALVSFSQSIDLMTDRLTRLTSWLNGKDHFKTVSPHRAHIIKSDDGPGWPSLLLPIMVMSFELMSSCPVTMLICSPREDRPVCLYNTYTASPPPLSSLSFNSNGSETMAEVLFASVASFYPLSIQYCDH